MTINNTVLCAREAYVCDRGLDVMHAAPLSSVMVRQSLGHLSVCDIVIRKASRQHDSLATRLH